MKARYVILRRGRAPVTGAGESVNLSTSGLLFRGETRAYPGDSVVAALDWPVSSDSQPLHLVVTGYVVRAQSPLVAISIASKGFIRAGESDIRFDAVFGEFGKKQSEGRRATALIDEDSATMAVISNILLPLQWNLKHAEAEAAKWMLASGELEVGLVITRNPDLLDCVYPTMPIILTVDDEAPEHLPQEAQLPRLAIVPRRLLGTMLTDVVQSICAPPSAAKAGGPNNPA